MENFMFCAVFDEFFGSFRLKEATLNETVKSIIEVFELS